MAAQIQVVKIKDDTVMGTSRDMDVFGRRKGSMVARKITFDIKDFEQRGYYKCIVCTPHGLTINSTSTFLLVEGMYTC